MFFQGLPHQKKQEIPSLHLQSSSILKIHQDKLTVTYTGKGQSNPELAVIIK